MKLKLLVDSKSSKVLFAEADKDFVDFLFSLLALPLGTVTRLLKQNDGMVGSRGVLYNSIESLSVSYLQPDLPKVTVLCPKVAIPLADKHVPLLKCEGVAYARKKLYRFSHCGSSNVSENTHTWCPSCSHAMSVELKFLNPSATADYADLNLYVCDCDFKYVSAYLRICPSCAHFIDIKVTYLNPSCAGTEKGGYVKGMVTYMVMDDLDVKPMSTVSSMSVLNTFNIKDVGVLEEKTVSIGMGRMAEGLKLLRASLCSKTVLTDVFLSKTDHEVNGSSAFCCY